MLDRRLMMYRLKAITALPGRYLRDLVMVGRGAS